MGCVVNGPGEAREADIGIAAGRGKGHLFIKGQVVRVVPEADMVEALLDEARKLVEEGVESRLAHAQENAAGIAAAAREELIQIQGDVNHSKDRRARVAEVARSD
jgi:(E)-4-hydroxy-3-methylbut-2-enyl-diphosphate synthase